MNKFLMFLCAAILALGIASMASAELVTFIDEGDSWEYNIFTVPDLWANWSTAGYSTFDWGTASWTTGNAAFGNQSISGHVLGTSWAANSDIALKKDVTLNGTLTGLTLNVASDNGFMIFVNGVQVAKQNAEGFTSYWEYTLYPDLSPFAQGINTVSVLAEDHGGATYFDMKLIGDVAPIPEPTTMLLLGSGLVGLAGFRMKFRKR